jgi:hypothetical protein
MAPLTNWAGNLVYATGRVHYPASVDEVQHVVRQCRRLRPLGSRHSFNRIADSPDNLVSVQRLNRVVSLDGASNLVTVEAGMTYGALGEYLHAGCSRRAASADRATLIPFGAVPHWGKLFAMSPSVFRPRYERLGDFRTLVADHDPDGRFRNEFIDRIIYDS